VAAGRLVARAIKDRVSKADLDEVSSHDGSISISLENLTRVEADTDWRAKTEGLGKPPLKKP